MIRRTLSPIDRMIDAACGIDPADALPPPGEIIIGCPACGQYRRVHRHYIDPDNAVLGASSCPDCIGNRDADPEYFDDEGRQLDFETGEPMS